MLPETQVGRKAQEQRWDDLITITPTTRVVAGVQNLIQVFLEKLPRAAEFLEVCNSCHPAGVDVAAESEGGGAPGSVPDVTRFRHLSHSFGH